MRPNFNRRHGSQHTALPKTRRPGASIPETIVQRWGVELTEERPISARHCAKSNLLIFLFGLNQGCTLQVRNCSRLVIG